MSFRRFAFALSVALPAWCATGARAETAPEDRGLWVQATYVRQFKDAFAAPYTGPRSLLPQAEASYSFTTTVALGWRPSPGLELYLNPEFSQGVPLSGLSGLGGFTNAELTRAGSPQLASYVARAFLRRTWGLGGGAETVESEINQLPGSADRRRVVLTLGKLPVMDLFDDNAYAHDPRTQFLNLAFTTHGAFDFAADVRGYSWGGAVEYIDGDWAIRAGRFAQPREPNQMALDPRIGTHYGDQIELERGHRLGERPGRLRLLVFRNQAVMASYRDALARAQAEGGAPALDAVRAGRRDKRGVGISLEQEIAPGLGLFARAMRADGATEVYAFAEIDRSLSAGLLLQGGRWGRPADSVGLAVARHDISAAHRDYLAAGGLGFFVGDGRLNPGGERILEAFYRVSLGAGAWLSLGHQRIANPGYNADRGPVSVTSMRLQWQR
ncbi:MAG: carbohydrate porin [Betaproteobacteria bacterium]|nr:carbohydrate porin [Betaproteobacteria bacterium]